MPPPAPGSAASTALYACADVSRWQKTLDQYALAIDERAATVKRRPPAAGGQGKSDLVELERWIREDWGEKGKEMDLTRDILEKIAMWKLVRGPWRPLLPRLRSNNNQACARSWQAAQDAFKSTAGSISTRASAAVDKFSDGLVGVGPAVASSVLAPVYPEIPFMSDEALDAVGLTKTYDLKTYTTLAERLSAKAAALGAGWTPELVGRALWACATLGIAAQSGSALPPDALKRAASGSTDDRPAQRQKTS